MRKEFGKVIAELGEKDKNIVFIVGDYGYGIIDEFKTKFPERFINMGICEQSMISIAAGMALEGLKPYVFTITSFLIERPFEQIKIDVDQQNTNVKLIGYGEYPTEGPTHNELNAKVMMSLMKNVECYYPKNNEETRKALYESWEHGKPTFISLRKAPPIK